MAKVTKSDAKISKSTEVTLAEIVELTNLSKTVINKLAATGYFKAERHGVYKLGAVMLGLLKYYREERKTEQQTAAQQRLLNARARQVELRIAQEEKELIPMADAIEWSDLHTGDAISTFNGLAAMLISGNTALVPHRAYIERVIDDARERLCEKWRKRAAEFDKAESQDQSEPDTEDDEAEESDA
jgi:hypothetical protein